MNVALCCTLAWLALVVAVIVYVERDQRRDATPHRFVIGFRSNALARPTRRWRWTLHPAPGRRDDVLDAITEQDLADLYRTHGWARTYLGATLAAHRARQRFEVACDQHRRELEEHLAGFESREAS